MNKKIIGITVGTTLPKPNFKQDDPTKGDYIKNRPDFDGLKTEVEDIRSLVGDIPVSEQVLITIEDIDAICWNTTKPELNVTLANFSVTDDGDGNIVINNEGV